MVFDACERMHNSATKQNKTDDGRLYCDKWEGPYTAEMIAAEIDAWLKTAAVWSGQDPEELGHD